MAHSSSAIEGTERFNAKLAQRAIEIVIQDFAASDSSTISEILAQRPSSNAAQDSCSIPESSRGDD